MGAWEEYHWQATSERLPAKVRQFLWTYSGVPNCQKLTNERYVGDYGDSCTLQLCML